MINKAHQINKLGMLSFRKSFIKIWVHLIRIKLKITWESNKNRESPLGLHKQEVEIILLVIKSDRKT